MTVCEDCNWYQHTYERWADLAYRAHQDGYPHESAEYTRLALRFLASWKAIGYHGGHTPSA
jgi:hypothetical protein